MITEFGSSMDIGLLVWCPTWWWQVFHVSRQKLEPRGHYRDNPFEIAKLADEASFLAEGGRSG
jgi:hypothetical protein